jgi:hypothetical protein
MDHVLKSVLDERYIHSDNQDMRYPSRRIIIWMLLLIGVMIAIRVLYTIAVPQIFFNTDSEGYVAIGRGIYTEPSLKTIINPYRTPLYPLFSQGLLILSGHGMDTLYSPEFFKGLVYITAVQSICTVAAFIFLFFALNSLGVPLLVNWILILISSSDFFLFTWERTVLTEGLAVPWIITLTALFIYTMRSKRIVWYVLLLVTFIFGFLLRPALILIPCIIVGMLWIHKRTVKMGIIALVLLFAYMLVPFGYAKVNEQYHKYYGIQHVGDIDLLGKILDLQLPVTGAKSYQFFYTAVSDAREKGIQFPNPFRFIEHYDPYIYAETNGVSAHLNELPLFNKTVILSTMPTYVMRVIVMIPRALIDICNFVTLQRGMTPLASYLFYPLQILAIGIQYIFFCIPVLWIVSVYQMIRKPAAMRVVLVLLGTLFMFQLAFSAGVVYIDVDGQHGRLMSLVRPHAIVFIGLWLYEQRKNVRQILHKWCRIAPQ